jgi:hypothetical protein
MSRNLYKGKQPYHAVVLGWDNPMQTFFAQVRDRRGDGLFPAGAAGHTLDLWVGLGYGEVPTPDELAVLLAPFGAIPADVMGRLRDDYRSRRPPSTRQRRMLLLADRLFAADDERPFRVLGVSSTWEFHTCAPRC